MLTKQLAQLLIYMYVYVHTNNPSLDFSHYFSTALSSFCSRIPKRHPHACSAYLHEVAVKSGMKNNQHWLLGGWQKLDICQANTPGIFSQPPRSASGGEGGGVAEMKDPDSGKIEGTMFILLAT